MSEFTSLFLPLHFILRFQKNAQIDVEFYLSFFWQKERCEETSSVFLRIAILTKCLLDIHKIRSQYSQNIYLILQKKIRIDKCYMEFNIGLFADWMVWRNGSVSKDSNIDKILSWYLPNISWFEILYLDKIFSLASVPLYGI